MNKAKIYEQPVVIPTYKIGKNNKNPMFFEKRVYQASSGRVYPYPIIDTLMDEKEDKTYKGIYLENDYLKILILPEIGGKIHRAIDKTNKQDFIYHNEVIKPALVGLLGPWVSGGIEFNWPQHHRPTTFMTSEYKIEENDDGSVTAILYDYDRMYGTNVVTRFTLFKDKSYIKINARLFNPTCENQTFLWWANPAVAVNDNTQSIFPPDVNAVYDHGKRAVSKFPIATGEYYKHDYSMGVDISRYKNIPVPTSYMAYKSKYDFVGNYDYVKKSGLLHFADHHISPGKKQWTWGNGDFGQAWDRNLTDKNGPYIELMTGVFTDNQPDFSWLKPFEEKEFDQYFMPYKEIGAVKNANKDFIMNIEKDKEDIKVKVYATGESQVRIILKGKKTYLDEIHLVSPTSLFEKVLTKIEESVDDLVLAVCNLDGEILLSYQEDKKNLEPLPQPQNAAKQPNEINSLEELYITGQHIEQYRHATFIAEDYYKEGLKRDPFDSRCNIAYANLKLKQGKFNESELHLNKAIERLTKLHPNPYDSEAFTYLGFTLLYQGKYERAYEAFYKATWVKNEAEIGFYQLAVIESYWKNYDKALNFVDKSLQANTKNHLAKALKAYVLYKENKIEKAKLVIDESLLDNPYNYILLLLKNEIEGNSLDIIERVSTVLKVADFFTLIGDYQMTLKVLNNNYSNNILIEYYKAYNLYKTNDVAYKKQLKKANETEINSYFPASLEEMNVLQFAIEQDKEDSTSRYLLGNFYYANRRYEEAYSLWKNSRDLNPKFSSVHRNLSIVLFNKIEEKEEALKEIEIAFNLDNKEARTFFELDQMYKITNKNIKERLSLYEKNKSLVLQRDDLKCEYATLLNLNKRHQEAFDFIRTNNFHPWEGGEGKISTQYVLALKELSKEQIKQENYKEAIKLLESALKFPENLGEGKLEGNKANDIYYYLGLCYEGEKDLKNAKLNYQMATLGTNEPASMLYYYDQPADMILYKGLAYKKLNKTLEANTCFNKLIDFGEQHYFDHIVLDYFAVSLPDLQLYEEDLDLKNKIHCSFLLTLGNYGLNDSKYEKYYKDTLDLDNSHFRVKFFI